MSNVGSGSQVLPDSSQEAGLWNEALSLLREWDPRWAGAAAKMMTNPWTSGVLPHPAARAANPAQDLCSPRLDVLVNNAGHPCARCRYIASPPIRRAISFGPG